MIKVLVYKTDFLQDGHLLNDYIQLIPNSLKKYVFSFVRTEDRLRTFIGKLLLLVSSLDYNIKLSDVILTIPNVLNHIEYNAFKKPYYQFSLKFNISHSGNYVLLAFSDNNEIGIDIEQIKEVDFSDFREHFNKKEWEIINNSDNPIEEFYNRWTIKESLIKAEGRGLYIPLINIDTSQTGYVNYCAKDWAINNIEIEKGYKCNIANEYPKEKITIEKITKTRMIEILESFH